MREMLQEQEVFHWRGCLTSAFDAVFLQSTQRRQRNPLDQELRAKWAVWRV